MTTTLTTLNDRTGMTFDPHLDTDDPVPVIVGPQAQGDIYVLPVTDQIRPAPTVSSPFPDGLVDIIEGQGNRNPHTLIDLDGRCLWAAGTAGYEFDVGTLTVPDGEQCFLIHPEHGGNGIGPGRYVIRRQRELAETVRAVAD